MVFGTSFRREAQLKIPVMALKHSENIPEVGFRGQFGPGQKLRTEKSR